MVNTPVKTVDLDAAAFPGGLGHMGYFRPKAVALWDNALEFFQSLEGAH